MFYLHVSNRTENLLRHLAELFRVDRQPDLFAQELFLIQSQGMERMIAQTMTDEFRCFCNSKFFLPLDFLSFVADRLGMGIRNDGFQRSILTWRIDGLLRNLSGEVYRPIRSYLSGDNIDLKRFQLARRLANIFDQYQIMRPDMLEKWDRGVPATVHSAEIWQMDLWRRLLTQPGGDVHRGRQFRQVIDRLKKEEEFVEPLPKRISVVGLHTLAPIFLHFLNTLSNHMDIHLFILSPCRSYWGNVQSRRTVFSGVGQNVTEENSPQVESHHPLLGTLGRQGRDLQNMMLENATFALEFTSYGDPLEGRELAEGSLLQQLQTDLLNNKVPDRARRNGITAVGDDSIQVVSCHSKLREITVLKDHILNFLHHDPELELRDIIVMAPDIQEYAPLIPAVFGDIQHSIADRSIRRRNAVVAAFLSFLDLFNGRFGWSEVLDVLRKPVIYPQFNLTLTDVDTLQQWVVRSGIRWGLSGRQRTEDGLAGFAEASWEAGIERMLMGFAIESDDFIDGVLPFSDIEGRAAYALGGLCHFIGLVEKARGDFLLSRTAGDWSDTLQTIIQQLFGDEYSQPLVELQAMVAELSDAIAPYHSSEVGFSVIREWFNQSAKESRSSSGFLRGQLTFCSMLPMRSIPFKVVCLVGLNDGVFPRNDNHDTFDLMGTDFRPGDRSPRGDDRYQFLEALLAARRHLYLSYIGQSIRTNETIPPSVVVIEFLEVLANGYGAADIVVNHPLHPFSKRYFRQGCEEKLFSYSDYHCKTAETLQKGPHPPPKWWQGELAATKNTVAFLDLLRFYANPQKFFIADCLDVRLNSGASFPDDREIFAVSGLDKYQVEEELVQSVLAGTEENNILRKMQIAGQWPLGASGRLLYAEKEEEVDTFIERVDEQQMGARCIDVPFDLTVGCYRLTGILSNLYEEGGMLLRYGNLRGRDLLSGWLHHLVLDRLVPAAETRIVALDRLVVFKRTADGPDLLTLLRHFGAGCQSPSMLFIEPAFAYALQQTNPRSKLSPLEKAVQTLHHKLEKGYEPEWALLFGESGEDAVAVDGFERLCQEIMCRVWSAADA
jgi:exodeoxyribonuclease V gamma subunit